MRHSFHEGKMVKKFEMNAKYKMKNIAKKRLFLLCRLLSKLIYGP